MERQPSKTVLVVDDDRVFVSRLTAALSACGYNVIDSQDVRQAYVLLDNRTVDLAVIDLNLPDKSGLELIHTTAKTCKSTRILAISAVLSDLHLDIAKYMGADEAIRKFSYSVAEPFPAHEWQTVVADLFERV